MFKVTGKSDFNELRIYINGNLHLQYQKEGHSGMKSYTDGSINKSWWIKFTNANGEIELSYKTEALWLAVLKEIDKCL